MALSPSTIVTNFVSNSAILLWFIEKLLSGSHTPLQPSSAILRVPSVMSLVSLMKAGYVFVHVRAFLTA